MPKSFSVICLVFLFVLSTSEGGCPNGCTCTDEMNNCQNLKIHGIPKSFDAGVRAVDLSLNLIGKVTSIPESDSLTFLNLSGNGITTLMYDAFDNLDNLKTLILSNNSISSVTDDIFEWNPLELEELKLDHNKLPFIQHFLLYDLEKLRKLDLSFNNISFIHPHAFQQLKSLKELNLANNALLTFDSRWLKGLHANMFEKIFLTGNDWSCDCAMQKGFNWTMDAKHKWVKKLLRNEILCSRPSNLNGMKLVTLHTASFTECNKPVISGISKPTKLGVGQSIHLQCVIDKNVYPRPSIVWIAPNKDHYSMHTADRFEGIEAYANGSLIIHNVKKDDSGTYNCSASNQKGTVVAVTNIAVSGESTHPSPSPATVAPGNDGTGLKNHSEAPQSCPSGCSCLSRHVDCSSESTETLHQFPQEKISKDTITLSVANNEITSVPPLTGLGNLEELRMDNNQIATLNSNAFETLTQLTTLTIRDNMIRTLPHGIFSELAKLQILVLDNNLLNTISPKALQGLTSLQWLYIRNNKIETIASHAFRSFDSIRFIHLEGNALRFIEKPTIIGLTERPPSKKHDKEMTINKIFVDDNQFVCDKQMQPLKDYLEEKKPKFDDLFGEGIKCSFPVEVSDKMLTAIVGKLNASDITYVQAPQPTAASSTMTGLWFGGLILGVILCVASFVVWKKWRCKWPSRSSYRNVPGNDDALEQSILGNNGGGGEAYV